MATRVSDLPPIGKSPSPASRRGVVLVAVLLAVLGLFALVSLTAVQVVRNMGATQQSEKQLRETLVRVLDLPPPVPPANPNP